MPYPQKPKLTDEQKAQAVKMWEAGYGVPYISRLVGSWESPVKSYFNSIGLKRSKAESIALRMKNGIVCKEKYAEKSHSSLAKIKRKTLSRYGSRASELEEFHWL